MFPENLRSAAQKNKGKDRFLVIFKISQKINNEKILVHTFALKIFYKNYNM